MERPTIEDLLAWRGIGKACSTCHGTGSRSYANTATWRGGVGGNALTVGVCDSCWGSGDAERPWTNLRKLEEAHEATRAKSTLDDLLQRIGGGTPDIALVLAAMGAPWCTTLMREPCESRPLVQSWESGRCCWPQSWHRVPFRCERRRPNVCAAAWTAERAEIVRAKGEGT